MKRICLLLVSLFLLVWCVTAGVHWATAILLSAGAVAGAGFVTFLGIRRSRQNDAGLTLSENLRKNVAPFHGFGGLGWMLIVMMTLTVFSMIPMPLGLLELFSPMSAQWYRDAWELSGADSSWGMISASFGRSAFALYHLVGFFGVYVFMTRLSGARGNILRAQKSLIVAGGILVAMLGLRFVGVGISFGAAGETAAWHIGLPVNSNHLSGVLAALSLISLGSVLLKRHHDDLARRILWFLIYALFGIAVIMLRSRGAILAWGIGQIFVVAYGISVSKQLKWQYGIAVLSGLGVVLACVLYISSSTITAIKDEIAETEITFQTDDSDLTMFEQAQPGSLTKTQMYGDFVDMAVDWGRAGTGRSAFYDVYPAYQGFPFRKHFRHAENEYWEVLLEYGWFWGAVCLILGGIGIAGFLRANWGNKDEHSVLIGFLAAVIALLVQNFFDFGLRYWTAGLIFWMSCGALEGRRLRWKFGRTSHEQNVFPRAKRIEYCVGYGLFAVACLCALVTIPYAVDGQSQKKVYELGTALTKNAPDSEKVQQLVHENMIARAGSESVRKLMAQAWLYEGLSHRKKQVELWSESRRWYESAIKLSPRDADALLHLAKLTLALGDEKSASGYFLESVRNNPRLMTMAMNEMSVIGRDNLVVPDDYLTFRTLIYGMIRRDRTDDALLLIQNNEQINDVQNAELLCALYKHIGFDDGCDVLIDSLKSHPMNIWLFVLQAESLLRQKKYTELFALVDASEDVLRREPEYWRKAMYLSAFYGLQRGESWYRESIPGIMTRFRQLSDGSRKSRFDLDYCEAQYAMTIGQFSRAKRSAGNALALKPGHKGAQGILNQAEKSLSARRDGK